MICTIGDKGRVASEAADAAARVGDCPIGAADRSPCAEDTVHIGIRDDQAVRGTRRTRLANIERRTRITGEITYREQEPCGTVLIKDQLTPAPRYGEEASPRDGLGVGRS